MRVLVVLIILFFGAGIFFIFLANPEKIEPPEIVSAQSLIEVEANEPDVLSIHSPDGEMSITMEEASVKEGFTTYSFYVSESSQEGRSLIFTKEENSGITMNLSPNAWSPDNKYVFINETKQQGSDFLVFRADGEDFSDGREYVDVAQVFEEKQTGNLITEVTGWDSSNLLHLFTEKSDGATGPSYWFEVPSGWIAGLSHR